MVTSRRRIGSKGFSLVELVIVIAIVAILTGGIALGVGMLFSADTKKLANQINSGFTELRSENMAMDKGIYMHLYWYDGDYYLEMTENATPSMNGSGSKLGCGAATVTLDKGGSNKVTLAPNSTNAMSFCMRKKDGAFLPDDINGTKLEATSEIEVTSSSSSSVRKIILVRDTGRHYLE